MRTALKSILIILLVLALLLFCASCGKQDLPEKTPPAEDTTDTALEESPANDAFDPENIDLAEEEGATVSASDLYHESGKANGIDVSKWQGKIDWAQVADSGIDFAIIRIGYRGENGTIYKDANADYNIQQAQQAGILIGVYFFSTAINEQEAKEEAAWTASAIAGYSISYPVVYDCEGFQLSTSRMYGISGAARTDIALAFLSSIRNSGYEAMLYAAKSELESPDCWETDQIASGYKIWIARYTDTPYPQTKNPDYSGRYDMWQYTSMGSVNGIAGNVDLIVSYFTCEKADPKDPSVTPAAAAVPKTSEELSYTAANDTVTAKEMVNLRESATTKSNVAGTLQNGETLTRTGIGANGWSRLEYNGKTVYAITSYLTTDLSYHAPVEPTDSFTQTNESVTAKSEVNLRTKPSTESDIAGTLKNGEILTRTGTSPSGWSRLSYNGQTVYAITSYLTTDTSYAPVTDNGAGDGLNSNTFTAVNDSVTAKYEVNLRALPTTDSEVVGTLANGEFLTRTAVSDKGWSRLTYQGQTVYAVTSYLTGNADSGASASGEDSGTDTGFQTTFADVNEQVTAKSETNLRTAPSVENSDVVYTLPNGEYITRTGVSTNGWSRLEYNGQTVYAISSYLTE